MPIQIACPSCGAQLRVGDDLLGRKVRCPKCATTFTAAADEPPEEGGAIQTEEPAVERPRRPVKEEEIEEEENEEADDVPRRRRRPREDDEASDPDPSRPKRPHHGPLVMTLGIVSSVVSLLGLAGCICCTPAPMVCGILGVGLGLPAWIMGQRDLAAMRRGEMSFAGENSTKAGWVFGIVGTILGALALLIGCGLVATLVAAQMGQRR